MSVWGKFVSQKISKVRWRPCGSAFQSPSGKSNIFVSGSWDDAINNLTVWQYPFIDDKSEEQNVETKLLWEYACDGNVTDLVYMNAETLVSSTSLGSINVYRHNSSNNSLKFLHGWNKIHSKPSACTSVATNNDEIVTVGEDGRICVMNIRDRNVTRTYEEANCCSLTAVTYLKQNEIITTNKRGQLSIWDLRTTTKTPAQTLIMPGEQIPILCVSHHPTQPHLIVSGCNDGILLLWDIRNDSLPACQLGGHDGPIQEVKFHPNEPDHLFTCSMNGQLWHWHASSDFAIPAPKMKGALGTSSELVNGSNWLMYTNIKKQPNIYSKLQIHQPINSLDVTEDTLICGADNEAIYVIDKVLEQK